MVQYYIAISGSFSKTNRRRDGEKCGGESACGGSHAQAGRATRRNPPPTLLYDCIDLKRLTRAGAAPLINRGSTIADLI